MKSIALCMTVKNEAEVILRCLRSACPLVDYVLVQDTGSVDETPEIVRSYLNEQNLPGEVYSETWTDFAANRSAALVWLRKQKQIDYVLMMDADDVIAVEPDLDIPLFKSELRADMYSMELKLGSLAYERGQLFRNDLPFRYRGVLHEFSTARMRT